MRVEGHELSELRDLAETTATVAAAYDAGVLRALAEGAAAAPEVAARAELDPRAVAILLPVLAEIGLVESDGDRFILPESTRRSLVDQEADEFEGGGLPLWLHNLRAFTRLPEVLASGKPLERPDESEDEARDSLARFMAGMAASPRARIERIVDACLARLTAERPASEGRPPTVLDLGGGPGHMTRAFVERGARGTLFDRPETIEYVGEAYDLVGVEGLDLEAGDFMADPLPDGPFDVVLISNVVHMYAPERNRELLQKVAGVTAPGGVVGIADFFRGRSRRAVRFALVMLFRTDGGNTYTEDEIAGWLDQAGFETPETVQVDDDRHLITARRSNM